MNLRHLFQHWLQNWNVHLHADQLVRQIMATPNNQAEQFYCSLLNKRKDILCPISTATEALSYSYMYCSQIGYTIKKKTL